MREMSNNRKGGFSGRPPQIRWSTWGKHHCLLMNKSRNTTGHLFSRPFKRIVIADDFHLTQLIICIHANIKKHSVSDNFQQYNGSSYRSILSQVPTHLKREEVLEWFGGVVRFISLHVTQADFYYHLHFPANKLLRWSTWGRWTTLKSVFLPNDRAP